MSRKRKNTRSVGDIVSVPLGANQAAFGWVLNDPLVAFFDYVTDADVVPDIEIIVKKPIVFRLWVMKYAFSGGLWVVVGHLPVPADVLEPPWFFKQDPITVRLSVTQTGAEEVPADVERCKALECAAVWDPQHVADRLRDHFAGRPNKWVDSMKIRL